MSIKRFVPSAGFAIGATTALGLFMAAMIATEFQPQEKGESLGFEINPVVEDIEEDFDREPPKLTQRIETPPPPPIIERAESGLPHVKLKELGGDYIPDYVPPVINPSDFVIQVADGDPQPIYRGTPMMPPRAQRSGHCLVRFDVSAKGAPYNITTTYCSQSLFKRSTVKSVEGWKFKPKISGGLPVAMSGLRNKVSYRLTDERGNLIPE